jgi:hypothetical protein
MLSGSPMRRFVALVVLFVALPVAADDVHLKNGRVFEDVEAEIAGSKVVVHLPYGEIGFSLSAVERIEESASSHSLYRQRRDELSANPDATAADWFGLARWARGLGLEYGIREAALTAARLDPALPGLDNMLLDLDFVLDPETGRWMSREEKLQRDGYEWVDGHWLSVEQQLARARLAGEVARAREADEERRLTRAVLALAAAQLAETSRPVPEPVYAWPVTVFPNPFLWRYPNPHRLPPRGHDPTAIPIERRQPGSLFPIASRGRLATSSARPSASRTTSGGSRS